MRTSCSEQHTSDEDGFFGHKRSSYNAAAATEDTWVERRTAYERKDGALRFWRGATALTRRSG